MLAFDGRSIFSSAIEYIPTRSTSKNEIESFKPNQSNLDQTFFAFEELSSLQLKIKSTISSHSSSNFHVYVNSTQKLERNSLFNIVVRLLCLNIVVAIQTELQHTIHMQIIDVLWMISKQRFTSTT